MHIEPGLYRHFKGALYRVTGAARHSETGEWLVLYHPEDRPGELWARPAAMWTERVQRDGYDGPRFAPAGQTQPG